LLLAAAELDHQAGRFEPAERQYEQLLVLQAAPEVYAALADIYRQQNRPEKLSELCGIVVAKGGGLAALATLLDGVGKSKEQSEAVIARARQQRETDPEHLSAGAALAAALLAQTHQDAPTADALFSHALSRLEKRLRAEFLLAWGVKLLLDRCYERAAPLFRQATAENLTDERKLAANFYLVRALALSGQTDDALQAAGQAAAAFPDSPRLQAQPGWVRYYAKRYAEAEQAYQALLERFDDQSQSPDIRDAMRDARLVLSNICVQQNNMKAAEEWLEQVLDEFPDDIGALNDLGYLWADQGKYLQRALDMVRRAVAGDPDNTAYRDSLGWALYRLGRYPEAVQELEKAAAGDDPDGVILDHLGDAYLRADRRADALAAWRRALDAFAKEGEQVKREATQKKIETCEK
jgi:tetratricopeptide (TPR) repeat protein